MSITTESELQAYLRNSPKNGLKRLKEEYGINNYKHPDFPLIGLKYDPIKSPKDNVYVMEARGIVFEEKSWNLIAKGFDYFPDISEISKVEREQFYWRRSQCTTQEDGTLILVYHYENEWLINTVNSFGLDKPAGFPGDWQDLFWKYAGELRGKMRRSSTGCSFIFELCTPKNKVVRKYKEPGVFLLGVNQIDQKYGQTTQFWNNRDVKAFATQLGVRMAKSHSIKDYETARLSLIHKEKEDPTFRGLVIWDNRGRRYKWQTESYKILRHLYGDGNMPSAKNLVRLVMTGEYEKVASVPEIAPAIAEVSETLNKAFSDLTEAWLSSKHIEDQKEFAAAVANHPFLFILFIMRKKHGAEGTVEQLKELWKGIDHVKIADRLFGKKFFRLSKLALKPKEKEPEPEVTEEPAAEVDRAMESEIAAMEDVITEAEAEIAEIVDRRAEEAEAPRDDFNDDLGALAEEDAELDVALGALAEDFGALAADMEAEDAAVVADLAAHAVIVARANAIHRAVTVDEVLVSE